MKRYLKDTFAKMKSYTVTFSKGNRYFHTPLEDYLPEGPSVAGWAKAFNWGNLKARMILSRNVKDKNHVFYL